MRLPLTAATPLALLKLLAFDGDLAKAEPGTLRYRILHAAACLGLAGAAASKPPLPGPRRVSPKCFLGCEGVRVSFAGV